MHNQPVDSPTAHWACTCTAGATTSINAVESIAAKSTSRAPQGPRHAAGEGLIELSKYNLEQGLSDARAAAAAAGPQGLGPAAALPPPPQPTVFAYHVLGRPLLLLAVEAAAFFLLVLLLERASADGDPWVSV